MADDSTVQRQWILLRCLLARRNGMSVQEMVDESRVAMQPVAFVAEVETCAGVWDGNRVKRAR